MATFDLLIKNGKVLDGVGNEAVIADIGIAAGEIKAIGQLGQSSAKEVIAADGSFVTPGFIDIQNHSDSYLTLLDTPTMPSLLSQGITTIAVGQCGASLAPLASAEALKSVQKWHSLAGANINWRYFSEYAEALKNYPLGVNVLSLVGHATLRRGLLGDQIRTATREEIAIIEKLAADSLASGAAGLSLGLVYAHEVNSSEDELLAVAKAVGQSGKLLSVHLRNEGGHVVSALEEVLNLAQKAQASLKISHFKIRDKQNYRFLDEALSSIDRAYQRGVNVGFDVYPYNTSWTVLYTYLPKWSYEGGKKAIMQNITDRSSREKILAYLKGQEGNLGNILIATSETNPSLTGKTLSQIALNQEVSVEEALLNVLAATSTQVIVFDSNLSEDSVTALLKHPLSMVATDGAGYDFSHFSTQGLVHPRCFGTMPRFLSLVREKQIMTWAEAVKKITSRPADKLNLKKRGRLLAGHAADIVIFDPRAIGSKATYENPYQTADGIEHVFVGGRQAFSAENGQTASAGQFLLA